MVMASRASALRRAASTSSGPVCPSHQRSTSATTGDAAPTPRTASTSPRTAAAAAHPHPAPTHPIFGRGLPLALPPAPDKGPTFDEALRARLRFLADKPPTGRTLFELEQTAALGVQLLALTNDPEALGRSRRRGGSSGLVNNPGFTSLTSSEEGPMAPSPAAETFASNMIREVISAVSTMNAPRPPAPPSLFELTNGIAEARRSKMPRVEATLLAELEARFGGKGASDEPTPARQKTPRKAPAASPRR